MENWVKKSYYIGERLAAVFKHEKVSLQRGIVTIDGHEIFVTEPS